ncbi:hypothetical protein LTR86_008209 [Recurvomyces mirabilis]|nr:hypothetical protein LTR86_008209 [Recurvomyces mirabilis]
MAQYVNRSTSFWKPYLDALPSPDSEFSTPLWFDDADDLAWIEGTDVLHTMLGRREVYEEYYTSGIRVLSSSGIRVLSSSGIDTAPYTWDLFRWAITMFTSRTFSSRAIAPQDSKYWTTYKTNAQGQRQTVLLDMSRTPAEDLDFSVLFPVQDFGNHSNNARVDWTFDPGRFSVKVNDPVEAEQEVFNNYGPKPNDELLMGYGFCIPDNPFDGVLLTLKPPPLDLQEELRPVQPGYFSGTGEWSSERTTVRLRHPRMFTPETTSPSAPDSIFHILPEPLLELLLYILRHERGVPFDWIPFPMMHLLNDDGARRYLPHIARMIVQSLMPKLQKLQNADLGEPKNQKQRQAAIYRSGQVTTIEANIAALRTFTRSLLVGPEQQGPRFVTLEGLLQIWQLHSNQTSPGSANVFVSGIEAVVGSREVLQWRQAGWEDDILVLALSAIYLDGVAQRQGWTPEYLSDPTPLGLKAAELDLEPEVVARAEGLMEMVRSCAQAGVGGEGSLWRDGRWGAEVIAKVGGRWVEFDGLMMMVSGSDGEGEEARLVVYLHGK